MEVQLTQGLHSMPTASKMPYEANAKHKKTFTVAATKQGVHHCSDLLYHTCGTQLVLLYQRKLYMLVVQAVCLCLIWLIRTLQQAV